MNHKPTYLEAARDALYELRSPSTPIEIVEHLKKSDKYNTIIRGQTPHKTIQSRISTDIINNENTIFYRVAPATFALKPLAECGVYPSSITNNYIGFSRRRQISKEFICAISRNKWNPTLSIGFSPRRHFPLNVFRHLPLTYVPARNIDKTQFYQLTMFLVTRHNNSILSFEPSEYDDKYYHLSEQSTIGLTGLFHEQDHDLFDQTAIGFDLAVLRTFTDFFRRIIDNPIKIMKKYEYMGIVFDKDTAERKNEIGIVVCADLDYRIDVHSTLLGYRNLRWRDINCYPDNFFHLEPWSQHIYRNLPISYE